MIELGELLGKFRNILLQRELGKKIIQEVLFEVVNIKTEIKEIEVKNSTLYLNIKPIYKNEILLKKELVKV